MEKIKKYTPEYHLKAFEQIAASLKGYTKRCVISFVDVYAKIKKNLDLLDSYDIDKPKLMEFAKEISRIAKENGCRYCYANYSEERVSKNCNKYDPDSPILCGILAEDDKIIERKVKALKEKQLSIFDFA